MKKLISLLLLCITINSHSQNVTLTLRPGPVDGKDALVWNAPGFTNGNTNYGTSEFLGAHAWTNSGNPDTARSLLSFDLSSIPPCAVIISATLSLYNNPNTAYAQGSHSTLSGSNEGRIRRITSSWNESTVTWFTKPSFVSQHEAVIPASSSPHQNYPNIDVKDLVQDMIVDPAHSFGFQIMLQNEAYYRALVLASSDCADSTLRPQLSIIYTTQLTSLALILQPGPADGKDAAVWKAVGFNNENVNYGNDDFMAASAWTNNGLKDTVRSMFRFDLQSIPAGTAIISAQLSLYNNPATNFGPGGAHSTLSGSNAAYIRKVTSDWDEQAVTWNSKPSYNTSNEVLIPASTNNQQNYINIDVTALTQDMINNPATNFGFLLMLQNEANYRRLVFGSSDCADPSLRPKLVINYFSLTGPTGICRPSTGIIYTANPSIPGTSYNWVVPAGATITSGQGTSSITVSFASNAVAGNISVTASNSCGTTSASKAIVIRSSVSATPGTITGSNVGCNGDCKLYTIRKVSTADYYIWTPPVGATINGSSSPFSTADTGVVVCYGPSFTGDSLHVRSGNCKGISGDRKLRINKTNPSTPGTISGLNVGLCNLSGVSYSINTVSSATSYTWRTNIAGATINGNPSPFTTTSTSVTVNFGTFTTGQMYVKANNGCGSSAERSLNVNARPAVPPSITGPVTLCTNQAGNNYSTVAVANASSYNWTLPSGGSITSGQGTTAIVMKAGTNPVTGNVRVRAQNICASSAYISKSVTINNCARLDSESSFSENLYIEAYPNPTSGILNIILETATAGSYRFDITDISGRTIRTWKENIISGRNHFEVETESFSSGIYNLTISGSADEIQRIKVIVQ